MITLCRSCHVKLHKGKIKMIKNIKWYQPHCKKCPYLVHDEIMERLHCIRPVGEGCLAESLLVAGVIAADKYNAKITAMSAERDRIAALPSISHKKIKRRR